MLSINVIITGGDGEKMKEEVLDRKGLLQKGCDRMQTKKYKVRILMNIFTKPNLGEQKGRVGE